MYGHGPPLSLETPTADAHTDAPASPNLTVTQQAECAKKMATEMRARRPCILPLLFHLKCRLDGFHNTRRISPSLVVTQRQAERTKKGHEHAEVRACHSHLRYHLKY
jgi:hypothetical protein